MVMIIFLVEGGCQEEIQKIIDYTIYFQ